LSQGRGGAGSALIGVAAGAADNRHGASLWSVSGVNRAHGSSLRVGRAEVQTAPAHRGFVIQ
jgi:hypothetical protein